jgi:hypothetical protein
MREKVSAPMTRMRLGGWRGHERVSRRKRKHESGADGLHVEGRAIDAELALHGDRGGGKRVVGRRRRDDDHIDLADGEPGVGQRQLCRGRRQVGRQLAFGGDVRSRMPVRWTIQSSVVSHDFRQLGVGQGLLGQIAAAAEND